MKEAEFARLMKRHIGIVHAVMKKFDNLTDGEYRDDFEQEIWLSAWNSFEKYKPLGCCDFSSWLWPTAEWAVLKFARKMKRWESLLPEDYVVPNDHEDTPYEEDAIDGLKRAIESFDGINKRIFSLYSDGYDIGYISTVTGLHPGAVSHRLQRGYEVIRTRACSFFHTVPRQVKGPQLSRRGANNRLSNRITQLTEDGKIITIFHSAGEAGRNGYDARRVMEVIAGKRRSYKGFLWTKTEDKKTA